MSGVQGPIEWQEALAEDWLLTRALIEQAEHEKAESVQSGTRPITSERREQLLGLLELTELWLDELEFWSGELGGEYQADCRREFMNQVQVYTALLEQSAAHDVVVLQLCKLLKHMKGCAAVDVGFTARPLYRLASHACSQLAQDPEAKREWRQSKGKREELRHIANARSTAVLQTAARHGPRALALFWRLEAATLQRALVKLGDELGSSRESAFIQKLLAMPGSIEQKTQLAAKLTLASSLFQTVKQNTDALLIRLCAKPNAESLWTNALTGLYQRYLGSSSSSSPTLPSAADLKQQMTELGKEYAEDVWARFGEQAIQRFGAYTVLLQLLQSQDQGEKATSAGLTSSLADSNLESYRAAVCSTVAHALSQYKGDAWRSLNQDLALARRLAFWIDAVKQGNAPALLESQLQSIGGKRRSLHSDSRAIAAQRLAQRHAKLHQHLLQIAPPT